MGREEPGDSHLIMSGEGRSSSQTGASGLCLSWATYIQVLKFSLLLAYLRRAGRAFRSSSRGSPRPSLPQTIGGPSGIHEEGLSSELKEGIPFLRHCCRGGVGRNVWDLQRKQATQG
jgi:hypothetical protein